MVLIIFIVIALYRRYKQHVRDTSMLRRAARYAKKKRYVKRKVRRMGPDGVMIEVEIEVAVSDDEVDADDEDDIAPPDAYALNVDHANSTDDSRVFGFDSPLGDPAIDEDVLADFKKEYKPVVAMTEKQRARDEREGKGASAWGPARGRGCPQQS